MTPSLGITKAAEFCSFHIYPPVKMKIPFDILIGISGRFLGFMNGLHGSGKWACVHSLLDQLQTASCPASRPEKQGRGTVATNVMTELAPRVGTALWNCALAPTVQLMTVCRCLISGGALFVWIGDLYFVQCNAFDQQGVRGNGDRNMSWPTDHVIKLAP